MKKLTRRNRRDEPRAWATKKELLLLQELRIIGRELERVTKVSHTTYHKFKRGEPIAQSLRDKIIGFVYGKLKELNKVQSDLNKG